MRLIIEFDEQKTGLPRTTSDTGSLQQDGGACRHSTRAQVKSIRGDGARDGGAATPRRRR